MLHRYLAHAAVEYLKLRYLDSREPIGCSLAPTIRCNLDCKHCYEKVNRASGKEELGLEAMDRLAERLSRQGMKHCTLTDGEPLISRESIDKCEAIISHFWMNYIVTNGTMEIIDFPVTYILSLDGPPAVHDAIRGEGVFHRLRQNLKASPTDDIYGLCTLNTLNHDRIADTIDTARDLGLRGVMFNWHTPSRADDPLWLDYDARNRDIDVLLRLIEKEPEFIYNTRAEMDVLRTPDWTRTCPSYLVPSYDAYGGRKEPCIFGEGALCEKCGCHVYPALKLSIDGKRTGQYRIALDFVDRHWCRDGALVDSAFRWLTRGREH